MKIHVSIRYLIGTTTDLRKHHISRRLLYPAFSLKLLPLSPLFSFFLLMEASPTTLLSTLLPYCQTKLVNVFCFVAALMECRSSGRPALDRTLRVEAKIQTKIRTAKRFGDYFEKDSKSIMFGTMLFSIARAGCCQQEVGDLLSGGHRRRPPHWRCHAEGCRADGRHTRRGR